MSRLLKRPAIRLVLALLLLNAVLLLLWSQGILLLNHPRQTVRGVDVSHYQGEINWPMLAGQDIRFAFIKATEGNAGWDERFADNWQGAWAAGLRVGAYHFFSFDSPGTTQAENFIAAVPAEPNALPPVIVVEGYGQYRWRLPDAASVVPQLEAMARTLREAYGRRPILYCNRATYRAYIDGRFGDCDIWYRDTFEIPSLHGGRPWTFWQYTDRGRLEGYRGEEKYIDLNVFCGTEAEFERYAR